MMLVELAKEAGLPDGVVNCIHGQHEGKLYHSSLKINLFLCELSSGDIYL